MIENYKPTQRDFIEDFQIKEIASGKTVNDD